MSRTDPAAPQPTSPLSPLSKREQRKQANRDSIMAAAIELFENHGCEATTLEDICARAEVSRPTFYSYYPSKQALIHALVERLWVKVANEFTVGFLSRSAGAESTTRTYITAFFDLTESQFQQYTRLERELIRQSMAANANDTTNRNMLNALTGMFAAAYQRGRERGEVTTRYDVDFLAEMSMGVIATLMTNWAVDEHYPLQKRLAAARQFLVEATTVVTTEAP